MVALAAPALRAEWTPVDASAVPKDLSARVVSDTLATQYDADSTTPVTVADHGLRRRRDHRLRPARLRPATAWSPRPTAVEVGPGTWQLDLAVAGDPAGDSAQRVVAEVRDLADDTGTDALVAGPAAEFVDQQEAIGSSLPLAVGLLVLLTLLVLWLMTGSVVLPVKAVVMNTLTVGVSLGALTWVYQDGRFTDLLGYTPNGGIEPTDFLVAAALVFALSTDYGVFLLGRIKEARDVRAHRARGRRDRPGPHRLRRHRRRDPAGRRDRRLQHQRDLLHPADRRGDRGRRPGRRVRRPLAAGAGADGPAGQVELVVADVAAPGPRPGRPPRARRAGAERRTPPRTTTRTPRRRYRPWHEPARAAARRPRPPVDAAVVCAVAMLVELDRSTKSDGHRRRRRRDRRRLPAGAAATRPAGASRSPPRWCTIVRRSSAPRSIYQTIAFPASCAATPWPTGSGGARPCGRGSPRRRRSW